LDWRQVPGNPELTGVKNSSAKSEGKILREKCEENEKLKATSELAKMPVSSRRAVQSENSKCMADCADERFDQ